MLCGASASANEHHQTEGESGVSDEEEGNLNGEFGRFEVEFVGAQRIGPAQHCDVRAQRHFAQRIRVVIELILHPIVEVLVLHKWARHAM